MFKLSSIVTHTHKHIYHATRTIVVVSLLISTISFLIARRMQTNTTIVLTRRGVLYNNNNNNNDIMMLVLVSSSSIPAFTIYFYQALLRPACLLRVRFLEPFSKLDQKEKRDRATISKKSSEKQETGHHTAQTAAEI